MVQALYVLYINLQKTLSPEFRVRGYGPWRGLFHKRFPVPYSVLPGCFFKGSHDFQDMESLAAVRPAAAAAAKGLRHISHTQSAAVILIIEYQRDFFKASFFRTQESNASAEPIGIGNTEGSFRTVDFQFVLSVIIYVKGGSNCSDCTVCKLENTITCVGTSTGTTVPHFGSLVMVRVSKLFVTSPVNPLALPSRLTRAVI